MTLRVSTQNVPHSNACPLRKNKDTQRVSLRQLGMQKTYTVGIVYTDGWRWDSVNSDTHANDNLTNFQDGCCSAKSWQRH